MCQWCVSCQWPFITNKSETFSTSPEQCFYDLGPPFRRSAIPGYYCYNNPNPNPNPNPRIPGMAGRYRLYTTLWSLKCSSRTCYHRVVRESNSKNSSHLNCDLQFRHIWILLITACRNIAREGAQNMHLSTTPLTIGCHNDDMIQFGPLHSQSLFHFV